MECKKCNTENLIKAKFCKTCGYEFTQEEKEKAQKNSTVEILRKVDDASEKVSKIGDILTLSFITDNIFVRIALIVVPFLLAMVLGGGDGKIKIRESDAYKVYYNTTTEEYYLEVDKSHIDLMLYVPKDTQQINVSFAGEETFHYTVDRPITIEARADGCYTVEAVTEKDIQSIVIYTVQ